MKYLILGGPYTGKTTAAKMGWLHDPELDEDSEWKKLHNAYGELRDAGADLQTVTAAQTKARKAYTTMFSEAIKSDKQIVAGHFSPETFVEGKTAGREVMIVVLTPEVYKKRFTGKKDHPEYGKLPYFASRATRSEAAVEQLASLVRWLNLDGKIHQPKIFQSFEAALSSTR